MCFDDLVNFISYTGVYQNKFIEIQVEKERTLFGGLIEDKLEALSQDESFLPVPHQRAVLLK